MIEKELALTQERLREALSYDPETGDFHWIRPSATNVFPGDLAGNRSHGYWVIRVDIHQYAAHRLAWLYVHGRWPAAFIDHINGDPGDNRLANLREATNAQNTRNSGRRSNNTSGYKGVTWNRAARKWAAQIRDGKRYLHLGTYTDPAEAHAAYCRAAAELHGEFARFE
jgi:hypothetical protein